MRFPKLDLSTRLGRLKLGVILLGLIMFFPAVVYIGLKGTSSSGFCMRCHIMKPKYYTWQASSHSEVPCIKCHIRSGLGNFFKHRVTALKVTYKYLNNDYILPVALAFPVNNDTCLTCHTFFREVTPEGDLIIPHKKHHDKKINCTTCHLGAAHGQISLRELNDKEDIYSFTASTGRRVMRDKQFRTVFMDACMECHQNRGGPLSCEACHSQSKLPASHKEEMFETKHGEWARNDLDSCKRCHWSGGDSNSSQYVETQLGNQKGEDLNYAFIVKDLDTETNRTPGQTEESGGPLNPQGWGTRPENDSVVAEYARHNDFCAGCHKELPVTHKKPDWKESHGQGADKEKCFACHGNYPGQPAIANTQCNTCHYQPHLKGWQKMHPLPVPQGTKPNNTCMDCHVIEKCASCHVVRKVAITKKPEQKYALQDPEKAKSLVPGYILKGYKPGQNH